MTPSLTPESDLGAYCDGVVEIARELLRDVDEHHLLPYERTALLARQDALGQSIREYDRAHPYQRWYV